MSSTRAQVIHVLMDASTQAKMVVFAPEQAVRPRLPRNLMAAFIGVEPEALDQSVRNTLRLLSRQRQEMVLGLVQEGFFAQTVLSSLVGIGVAQALEGSVVGGLTA